MARAHETSCRNRTRPRPRAVEGRLTRPGALWVGRSRSFTGSVQRQPLLGLLVEIAKHLDRDADPLRAACSFSRDSWPSVVLGIPGYSQPVHQPSTASRT